MRLYTCCARGTAALVLIAGALSACAGGGSPAAPAKAVDAPPSRDHDPGEGIGLGNLPRQVDAGPDAYVVSPDALASRAKQTKGRLAPEKIQEIVRAGFGEIKKCYERGLGANPNLTGRVSIQFVIDREGRVASAGDDGSDLPDPKVIQCVVDAFKKLRFPKPEGGIVTVVYPIIFQPGD